MKNIYFVIFLLILISANIFAQINQSSVDRQINYLNSQIKYFSDQAVFSVQITTITTAQYQSQKPADALSFDCGYLDESGKVFVSDPATTAQKKYFTDITEAAVYYLNQSFLKFYYKTNTMPLWFLTGFAAFEADLKISDALIKEAINNYGGSLPSFTALNNRTDFDNKDGIAIAYLWGELMNVYFGWWKYIDVGSLTSETVVMNSWATSMEDLFKVWRRYTNVRILETVERFRVKFQGESDHFKFYYRDNENYCMPYMQNAIEEPYALYSTRLNIQNAKKVTYLFQPECEGAKIDSIPCPNRYTGGTAWASGLTTSCADKVEDLPRFKDLAWHELAHLFQFLIRPEYQPAWLSEGFASFLPDGVMNSQYIANFSGEVNARMEEAKAKLGHYPTVPELEDYGICSTNGVNYYLIGLIMNDFIYRKGGYQALKNTIASRGQDFTAMGYTTKQQFETGFYDYYNQTWKPNPKSLSIKKVIGKPVIDGKLDEATWEKNIPIDRKFWMDYYMKGIPVIDNTVNSSVMYDDENLYIGFEIKDGSLISGGALAHQLDGVEVDIDPDLSRGIGFTDSDMAFIWNYGGAVEYRSALTGAVIASSTTAQGYSVEISIPWSKLNVTPVAGKKFGLELCNYDRDNDGYKGAFIYSGHSWNNGIVLNGLAEVTLSSETITAPRSCRLLTPTGSETFIAGDSVYVKWNYTNIGNIRLEYSADNGANWSAIKTCSPAQLSAADSLKWLVPASLTSTGKIRIVDVTNENVLDAGNSTFNIVRQNSHGGPYLRDDNTVVLLHFENTLENKSRISGKPYGTANDISYAANSITDLGKAVNLKSPVYIPHSAGLNLTGNWTIEAWIRLNSYNNETMFITKPGDNNSYFANYTLEINPWWGNVIYGFYFDQGSNRIGTSGFTPALNKWYHIAYIRDIAKKEISLIVLDENRTQVYSGKQSFTDASVLTNSRDLIIDSGLDGYIDEVRISNMIRDFTVGIEDEKRASAIPSDYELMQNYPNPFNPSTIINYTIPVETPYMASQKLVTLKVFDLLGREVTTLVNEAKPAGTYSVKFDASNLPSGIYFYRLTAGSKSDVKKMILMK